MEKDIIQQLKNYNSAVLEVNRYQFCILVHGDGLVVDVYHCAIHTYIAVDQWGIVEGNLAHNCSLLLKKIAIYS